MMVENSKQAGERCVSGEVSKMSVNSRSAQCFKVDVEKKIRTCCCFAGVLSLEESADIPLQDTERCQCGAGGERCDRGGGGERCDHGGGGERGVIVVGGRSDYSGKKMSSFLYSLNDRLICLFTHKSSEYF